MIFDIAIIGFGVIGVELVSEIIKVKNKKNIKILILEKDINNIPGGVAYSKVTSKYGFFNNPLRLSNPEFAKWIKKNQYKLIRYIKQKNEDWLNDWLGKNKKILNNRRKSFDEIYFPRLAYSLFLQNKIKNIIKLLNKKKINLFFFNGDLINISQNNNLICKTKDKSYKILINYKFNKLKIKKTNKYIKFFNSKNIVLGNGLLPPADIGNYNIKNNKNYIWDFYSEGGTLNLIKKIKEKIKKKKLFRIVFIGNKAGLLETMPELLKLSKKLNQKIKIVSISPTLETLEKAEFSNKFSNFKFKYLNPSKILDIKKSSQILNLLKKEFKYAVANGYNKYDVWTWALKKDIIKKCYSQLSIKEKYTYNQKIFSKIRNITRYTYPNTIYAREKLENYKTLTYIKDKVVKLSNNGKYIKIHTKQGKVIKSDIVINVSGPEKLNPDKNQNKLINSIIKMNLNYNERGFIADKDFCIGKNIYAPGILSSNFNPHRYTIIKAVTMNCKYSARKILKKIS
tara:strand:- start:378 stop:1910 length:1533 start_codon:yes stop_codon:yes gene_type:complete